jgi:hypothetical protein
MASHEDISESGASRDAKNAGRLIQTLAVIAGLLWIAGAGAFLYAAVGVDKFRAMEPALQAALAVATVLPAFLIWFAGAAAREGARARREARRLADAAERLLSPAPAAEAAARRLGVSVRGEIASLERAIDQALVKAREVEQLIAKQTLSMDSAVTAAATGASQMITGMERERNALLQIAEDLNSQAGMIGDSISRHVKAIAEAARAAETEIRGADEALDSRLSSFGAAAALISDRTGALSGAAKVSADSALKLESILGGALDALTKASTLTDAARQSAEAATFAANNTANAVRDATRNAVDDAKRAADMIRAEAAAVEREAAAALERMREAADEARVAAQAARSSAGATAADVARQPLREPEPTPAPAPAPTPFINSTAARRQEPRRDNERRDSERRDNERRADRGREGYGESLAGVSPRAMPAAAPTPLRPAAQAPNADADSNRWTWREVLASIEDAPAARTAAARAEPAEAEARARHPIPAVGLIEAAGLRLGEVFNLSTLDRIAQRARNGTQARRRAVRDASPDAVRRLADYLERDQESRTEANEFMRTEGVRIAELLGRGRASMSADATRAFLLIDAASA